MKTNKEFREWLNKHGACSSGMEEVAKQTPEEFYNTTKRGDWLMWWITKGVKDKLTGYPTLQQLQKCALDFARMALPYTKNERLKTLLDEVENFLAGNTKIDIKSIAEEVRKIRYAAYAAAYAAYAAAYAAAAAAAYAAYAAAAAAADAAAYAAYAAAAAAADAAAADADAAAADAVRKKIADYVRENKLITFN